MKPKQRTPRKYQLNKVALARIVALLQQRQAADAQLAEATASACAGFGLDPTLKHHFNLDSGVVTEFIEPPAPKAPAPPTPPAKAPPKKGKAKR